MWFSVSDVVRPITVIDQVDVGVILNVVVCQSVDSFPAVDWLREAVVVFQPKFAFLPRTSVPDCTTDRQTAMTLLVEH